MSLRGRERITRRPDRRECGVCGDPAFRHDLAPLDGALACTSCRLFGPPGER